MPFAGFKDFADCEKKIREKNPDYTDEQVKGTCGKLQAEHEGKSETKKSDHPELAKAEWVHALPNILASPRIVEMKFHIPKVDKDKEIISASAMSAALEDYRYFPIISEFHKERPIGIAEKIWQTHDDEFKALARIREDPSVDDVWQKIVNREYNQVSIAGRRTNFSPECNLHQAMRSADRPCRTEGLRLDSISVCDERARNDETSLNVVKASSDDPAAFVFTTALEIKQVEDTLIKAETSNSPLIHPVTDGTKEPPVKKGEEDMKEKEMDEEKEEHSQEKKEEEKKGEAGTPEKQEMEKAPAENESSEMKLLKAIHETLKELVASDKKVHESVKAKSPPEESEAGKEEDRERNKEEKEEEAEAKKEEKKEEKKCHGEPVKKSGSPGSSDSDLIKAQMEQDFKKALDVALAPIHQQIADLTKKLEEYGDQPVQKAVVLMQTVDNDGHPVLGNAGALAEQRKNSQAVKSK
jgi:hypothetical protein